MLEPPAPQSSAHLRHLNRRRTRDLLLLLLLATAGTAAVLLLPAGGAAGPAPAAALRRGGPPARGVRVGRRPLLLRGRGTAVGGTHRGNRDRGSRRGRGLPRHPAVGRRRRCVGARRRRTPGAAPKGWLAARGRRGPKRLARWRRRAPGRCCARGRGRRRAGRDNGGVVEPQGRLWRRRRSRRGRLYNGQLLDFGACKQGMEARALGGQRGCTA